MYNELFLIIHAVIISLFAVCALKIGKEALISLLCIQAILSNLFVSKQIIVLGLCATCSDAFSVGSSLSLNLLQEYYGKTTAQKTIWISFFTIIFYLIMTKIHLLYIPASFDTMHPLFVDLLNSTSRIIIVSLFSYLITQQIDAQLYSYFNKLLSGRLFIFRNYGSVMIAQLIDTLILTYIGLYNVLENPFQVFIISYLIKLFTIFIAAPVIGLSKKLIKTD